MGERREVASGIETWDHSTIEGRVTVGLWQHLAPLPSLGSPILEPNLDISDKRHTTMNQLFSHNTLRQCNKKCSFFTHLYFWNVNVGLTTDCLELVVVRVGILPKMSLECVQLLTRICCTDTLLLRLLLLLIICSKKK